MAYDEGPRPARREKTRIIIAVVVIVAVLILFWIFFRPDPPVVVPGAGVDVVEPVDEIDVADPADDVEVLGPADDVEDVDAGIPADGDEEEDVEAVPATVDEGAWVPPGRHPYIIEGLAVMAA